MIVIFTKIKNPFRGFFILKPNRFYERVEKAIAISEDI
jgi:hypothetical protein